MPPEQVLRHFGLSSPLSRLHPRADVWLAWHGQARVVLKRTSTRYGDAVAAWTRRLAADGTRIVTPVELAGGNPCVFGDDRWVVYPFVAGARYRGGRSEIRAAGELLGRIHAAGARATPGLQEHVTVRAFAEQDVRDDVTTVLTHVCAAFPELADVMRALLEDRVTRYVTRALPRLRAARLPLADGSWDHKAANLVFVTPEAPTLVDPDNAARLPRVYDLAITALAFHLDPGLHDGPVRLFTVGEWGVFLKGYAEHVRLTDEERLVWADVLLCAWMDEALWQLQDDAPGWRDVRTAPLLLDLLRVPHPFTLLESWSEPRALLDL
ncbi:phosphotransferase enzyme family protein [Deinococcus pimensis]|uniref:phosphotransferase enzyme family protein n=1 Tax=Deinococcus pimensis TaxID=309888 RepID=UPI000486F00F|nr:hypothetical protein [Deinococcus pimensis]